MRIWHGDGLFLSLIAAELAASEGELPTIRVDEITLHPRDNAMVVATHGRGMWILDHRADQEYAGVTGTADAKLFSIILRCRKTGRPERRVLGSPVLGGEPAAGSHHQM